MMFFAYVTVSGFLLKRKKIALASIRNDIRNDKTTYAIISGIFTPFIITSFLFLTSIIDMMYGFTRQFSGEYRNVAKTIEAIIVIGLIYLPSYFMFLNISTKETVRYLLPIILIGFHWYFHMQLQGQLALLFRLLT